MADYIYTTDGTPQAFRLNNHIYDMDGVPVGRVWAEKVYTLGGDYVGALVNNMVVAKPNVSKRGMAPAPHPGNATPPGRAESRRPVGEAFADVFHLLTEEAGDLPR